MPFDQDGMMAFNEFIKRRGNDCEIVKGIGLMQELYALGVDVCSYSRFPGELVGPVPWRMLL